MDQESRPGRGSYTGYHSDARRSASGHRILVRMFKRHALAIPLIFLVVGAIPLGWIISGLPGGQAPPAFGFAVAPLVLLTLFGLLTVPFGIRSYLYDRSHPLVLTCPKCGLESRSAATPFKIQRWNDVDYSSVVCSYCGSDFTVPRSARLI